MNRQGRHTQEEFRLDPQMSIDQIEENVFGTNESHDELLTSKR